MCTKDSRGQVLTHAAQQLSHLLIALAGHTSLLLHPTGSHKCLAYLKQSLRQASWLGRWCPAGHARCCHRHTAAELSKAPVKAAAMLPYRSALLAAQSRCSNGAGTPQPGATVSTLALRVAAR
jgi:hypothetical protein